MRPAAAAAVLGAALALAACGEDGDGSGDKAKNGTDTAALNCRGDLPDPTADASTRAELRLEIGNFDHSYVDGRHRYSHVRQFLETGGVGATVYRGKVCVEGGTQCADACVDYRVPANASLVQGDHHVATPRDSDRITLKYWLRDDAGHRTTLTRTIATDGESARVVE